MKQHITIDQLNELTDLGKSRLEERFMWKDGVSFILEIDTLGERKYIKGDKDIPLRYYPNLSIGQMIEFLDEYSPKAIGMFQLLKSRKWSVQTPFGISKDIELCDSLWAAVKQVLEDPTHI